MMTSKRRNTSSPEAPSPPPHKKRRSSPKPLTATRPVISYDDLLNSTPRPCVPRPTNLPIPDAPPLSYDEAEDHNDNETSYDAPLTSQFQPEQKPHVNPTYGQRGAFPGLENHDPNELFYGPASDGLEYLRMVRSEANTLPCLFVAPKEDVSSNGLRNGRDDIDVAPTSADQEGGCYYSDGTYVANPQITPTTTAKNGESPQDSYHSALHLRYTLLRATLRCTPPASAISALSSSHPIIFPPENRQAYLTWRRLVQTVEPTMVQLACMDVKSALRVVGIVGGVLVRCVREAVGEESVEGGVMCLGAWCWGLLGKMRERGEMGSEEVSDVRELGKRAVEAMKIVWRADREREGELCEEGEVEEVDGDEESDDETWKGFEDEAEPNHQEDTKIAQDALHGVLDASIEREADKTIGLLEEESLNTITNGFTNTGESHSTETFDIPSAKVCFASTEDQIRAFAKPQDHQDPTLSELELEAAKNRLSSSLLSSIPPDLFPPLPKQKDHQEQEEGEIEEPEVAASSNLKVPPRDSITALLSVTSRSSSYSPEPAVSSQEATMNAEDDLYSRTRAMLDMIITIVGEEYGQRDLLEGREVWG